MQVLDQFTVFNKMRIMQLQLYLFIWCQAAATLTDQVLYLGKNVTINCSLDLKEVTWLLVNPPDPPVLILRSFLNPPATFYFNNRFRQKYSVQSKHYLFITNVSIDELGVYYCTNIDRTAQFSNGTRLDQTTQIFVSSQNHSILFTVSSQNHTIVHHPEQTTWPNLTLIFGLIIAVLVIVVIVFLGILQVFADNKHPPRPEDLQQLLMLLEKSEDSTQTLIYYEQVG